MMQRYNTVAISLHWLIAFFLLGLLAIGKYMTGLDEVDPLRFTLTQWHKSFGIAVLLLALARIVWRLGHRPPVLPNSATGFERVASHATHLAMYVLMVVIPVSGWVMVSVSPLSLKTELFGVIPLPHIGFLTDMANRESMAARSVDAHMWLANTLLVLVLLHVAAAFFHQFFKKDELISRMLISAGHRSNGDVRHGMVVGLLLAAAGSLYLFNLSADAGSSVRANGVAASVSGTAQENPGVESSVGFTALQLGEPVVGSFEKAKVSLSLNVDQIAAAFLTASVQTDSVNTGDSQLDGTVVTADWFSSAEYPEATFTSSSIESVSPSSFFVRGEMTIKGVSKRVEFEMTLNDGVGRGEFEINRSDFGVGEGQDEFVDKQVVIRFETRNTVK